VKRVGEFSTEEPVLVKQNGCTCAAKEIRPNPNGRWVKYLLTVTEQGCRWHAPERFVQHQTNVLAFGPQSVSLDPDPKTPYRVWLTVDGFRRNFEKREGELMYRAYRDLMDQRSKELLDGAR
jgi:hypothetical protein